MTSWLSSPDRHEPCRTSVPHVAERPSTLPLAAQLIGLELMALVLIQISGCTVPHRIRVCVVVTDAAGKPVRHVRVDLDWIDCDAIDAMSEPPPGEANYHYLTDSQGRATFIFVVYEWPPEWEAMKKWEVIVSKEGWCTERLDISPQRSTLRHSPTLLHVFVSLRATTHAKE